MVYKFEINTNQPSFVDITDELEKTVAQSDCSMGLCVVTVSDPLAAIAFVEGANEKAKADILSELSTAIPQGWTTQRWRSPHLCRQDQVSSCGWLQGNSCFGRQASASSGSQCLCG